MMIIYKALNKDSGKIYIGKTIRNLKQRIAEHLHQGSRFGNALRKYGVQAFEWSIIDSTDCKELLIEKEIYWIGYLNSKIPFGYNVSDGGEGNVSARSEATRKKMSEAKMGYKASPESIAKRVLKVTGLKRNDETKLKMSKAMTGFRHLESTKTRLSALARSRWDEKRKVCNSKKECVMPHLW